MTYFISIATLALIYILLSVSLSLLVGHTGIFSLAQAGIFGIGAYTSAILTADHGVGFVPAGLAAIAAGVVVSAIMAIPSLRVSGDYFVVASLAMQTIVADSISHADSITHGTSGITGITRPVFGSVDLTGNLAYLEFVAVIVVIGTLLCAVVARSPFGRSLHALRDDELVATTLGKRAHRSKIVITMFVGAMAAVAGVLYAYYILFLSPDAFVLDVSITIMTMAIVGGMTSILGAALGAVIITLLPEGIKQLALSDSVKAALQQMIFGALLVIIMFLRPKGILGDVRFAPALHRAQRLWERRRQPDREQEAHG